MRTNFGGFARLLAVTALIAVAFGCNSWGTSGQFDPTPTLTAAAPVDTDDTDILDTDEVDTDTVLDNADADDDGYFRFRPGTDEVLDCNDARNDVYPGAPEKCDGVDNDCDGVVDENCDVSDTGDTGNGGGGNSGDELEICWTPDGTSGSTRLDLNSLDELEIWVLPGDWESDPVIDVNDVESGEEFCFTVPALPSGDTYRVNGEIRSSDRNIPVDRRGNPWWLCVYNGSDSREEAYGTWDIEGTVVQPDLVSNGTGGRDCLIEVP